MGKKIKILAFVILSCMLLGPNVLANSAIKSWSGADGHNTAVMTEDCPVICQHEDLVFDIPVSYQTEEDYFRKDREASVSATYTLHNPTEQAVDVRLAFPFGKSPYYVDYHSITENELLETYSILRNGENLEYKVRQTLAIGDFKVSEDIARLRDSYNQEGFFTPEQKIYLVTYEIDGTERDISLTLPDDNSYRIMDSSYKSLSRKDGSVTLTYHVRDGKQAKTIYICGANVGNRDWDSAGVKFISAKEMTFLDFTHNMYHDSLISDVDWFNIWADYCNHYGASNVFDFPSEILRYTMRWLEYSLHFEAGETLTNTVKAPIYPDIDSFYHPSVFTYHYLLTPASGWASFGDLDITVKTPDFLIRDNTFTKGEGQYTKHEDSLPKSELSFALCSVEKPERPGDTYSNIVILFLLGSFVLFVILIVLLIVLIKKIRKMKKRNRK